MGQSWFDVLFAHWRVPRQQLEAVVPPQLPIDEIDGSVWITVTPFEVRALRLRFSPPLPVLSAFPELNVRTYVSVADRPGIYFFSLDAHSRLAVASARRLYRLPYFRAEMQIERDAEGIRYRSVRADRSGEPAALSAFYRASGPTFQPTPGSLEAELTERYCAYTLDQRRRVKRADIHHRPWRLRRAVAEFDVNTMTAALGIELAGEPLLHVARRQDVLFWPLTE